MDHAWISIIAAIGASSLALESIYLGYRLFLPVQLASSNLKPR